MIQLITESRQTEPGRLAAATTDSAARESFEQLACDYTEIADELEQSSDLPAPELPETGRY